jgi:Tol biopolymer transport system component
MGSRRLVGQSRPRSASTLIVSVSLGVAATAHASDTLWLAPVSGSFGDPARWSNGVPAESSYVRFGLAPSAGVTFDITLDQPRSSQSLEVTNQSLALDLAGLANPLGFAYVTGLLRVAGDPGAGASLTLRGGDVVAISTLVGGVPPSTEAGSLVIEGGEFRSDAVLALGGSLVFDGVHATNLSTINQFWRVGDGIGSVGAMSLTNGSTVQPTGLVVGGSGGVGTLSVTGGSTLQLNTVGTNFQVLVGGGKATFPYTPTPGDGEVHVAGATITSVGNSAPLRLGFGGEGLLVLDDGAIIDIAIAIGTVGEVRCVGDATLVRPTVADLAATPTLTVLEGASLHADTIAFPSASGAVAIAPGASLSAEALHVASGVGTTIERSASDRSPAIASPVVRLHGPIEVAIAGRDVPRPGASMPLIDAEWLECGRATIQPTADVAGYLVATQSSLSLQVARTVNDVSIAMPDELAPGFAYAATLHATVDGAPIDAARFAAWSSSNPSIAAVEGVGVFRALGPGRATISATFGGQTVSRDVRVAADAATPFVLASAAKGGAVEGAADADSGTDAPGWLLRRGGAMSSDGSVVVFASEADNLVPGDDNGVSDVFAYDTATGTLERISMETDALTWSFGSDAPCVSPDGRYVAFRARTNDGGTSWIGPIGQVLLRDRALGTTELITITIFGFPSNGSCEPAAISADGQRVLFTSRAKYLVSASEGLVDAAYLRDRTNGVTTLISTLPNGLQMNDAYAVDMTPDATRALLISNDWNDSLTGAFPVLVKDLVTGAVLNMNQSMGTPSLPRSGSISDDGRYVAFTAIGLGLPGPPPPPDYPGQVFVRDLETNDLTCLTCRDDGTWGNGDSFGVTISPNGRYVTFVSEATNLFPPGTPVTGHPQVIRVDRITGERTLVSEGAFGPNSGTMGLWTGVRDDGRSVTFATDDPQFVSSAAVDPENPVRRVLVRSLGPETPSDLDGDGAVGASDLGLLLAAWNTTDALADLNGDGTVDALDLGILLGAWGS